MELLDCKILHMDRFGVELGYQPTDALFYVLEGSFSLSVDGKTRVVTKNELVAFPNTMFFERHILSPLKFYYIKLVFPGEMPRGVLPVENRMRLLSTLTFMTEILRSSGDPAKAVYYLNDIFLQIEMEKQMKMPAQDRVVTEVLQYFEAHLGEKISLQDIAGVAGISASGLISRFKAVTGHTPIQHLIAMRLRLAEELLVTTDATLTEIASQCGYDNAFYLSNAFKKETGESPYTFRKKYRF